MIRVTKINLKCWAIAFALLGAIGGGLSSEATAKPAPQPAKPELTEAGKKLESKYTAMLSSVKAELTKELPKLDDGKRSALEKARVATETAQAQAESAKGAASNVGNIAAKIANWKQFWIRKADQNIQKAQADLKAATTDAQREAAKRDLEKWQANKADGEKAIKDAQAELDKAKTGQSTLAAANDQAQKAVAQAQARELDAAKALLADVDSFLAGDKLDAKLVKCEVLSAGTPAGLAAFAQQGKAQEALVDQLLADDKLMKALLIAGGANFGRYGQAMEIYNAIRKASPKALADGALHRLAWAVSLELAKPIKQSNSADESEGSETIDPVKRFQHYEKAYLAGELDPAFKTLEIWELRGVVGASAPDEILTWGREMLRNYRPDMISNPNYGWRYSEIVRTDVRYGSDGVKDDLPSLNGFQNIIRNGGVCGRRAFFGRYILQAFGIPVWGVTQHKHAAVSHWTPDGWVVNLGAGFDKSWWDKGDVPRGGSDFLIDTKARKHRNDYVKVLRAEWAGRALGEKPYNGRKNEPGGPWSRLGHYQSRILASKESDLGPLGQELAEANEPEEVTSAAVTRVTVTDADKRVVVAGDGMITVPAAAIGGKVQVMKSYLGGQQQLCGSGPFTCTVDAPRAGKYLLTARVVTVHGDGNVQLTVNKARDSIEIALPYTIGKWQSTKPAEITLVQGKNELAFKPSARFSLKDVTLTPVK